VLLQEKIKKEQSIREWVQYIRGLGLEDDARLAEAFLQWGGLDVGFIGVDKLGEAYDIARAMKVSTEAVSKVLTGLRRSSQKKPEQNVEIRAGKK